VQQAILPSVKSFKILDDYIEAALETARYEKIEKGTKVYAEIPAFRGAWADGKTREAARRELRQVLRGWIEIQLERGQPLPAVKGIRKPNLTFA
jgi:predicted RNase H-like HicB family nuclease